VLSVASESTRDVFTMDWKVMLLEIEPFTLSSTLNLILLSPSER
jgi:hypothetical protein